MAGRHQVTVSATCLAEDFAAIFATGRRRHPQPAVRRAGGRDQARRAADGHPAGRRRPRRGRRGRASWGASIRIIPYGRRPRGTVTTVPRITPRPTWSRSTAPGSRPRGRPSWSSATSTRRTVFARRRGEFEGVGRRVASASRRWRRIGPAPRRDLAVVPMMNKAQADIAYAFVGMRRSDPAYYAAWVMNNALGQYALGGRLGDSIREQQGMAYYVYSSLDASARRGSVDDPRRRRRARRRAHARVDRSRAAAGAAAEGFTVKEVDESKRYLIGSIPRQLETNAGIAGFLLSAELHRLGPDYDRRLPGHLERRHARRGERRRETPARSGPGRDRGRRAVGRAGQQ